MGNFELPSIIAETGTSVAAVSTDPVEGTSGIADRLGAEREIRRRLLDYCRGIDTCDVGLVASVYHPDSFDDHGSFQGSGHDLPGMPRPHCASATRPPSTRSGTQLSTGWTTERWPPRPTCRPST